MTKICSVANGCGETKLLSEFKKDSRRKDGYENRCKKCRGNKVTRKDVTNKKEPISTEAINAIVSIFDKNNIRSIDYGVDVGAEMLTPAVIEFKKRKHYFYLELTVNANREIEVFASFERNNEKGGDRTFKNMAAFKDTLQKMYDTYRVKLIEKEK